MCLLEVAMCEKCRSSHFQWEERAVKSLRTGGVKKVQDWGVTFAGVVSTALHAMLLLVENVTSSYGFGNQNYIFQKGATPFNRSTQNMLYFYVTLHKAYIFLTKLVTSLVYTEQVWKTLFLRNRNRFYLNSRSYPEINNVCSNKWALYQPRH